MRDEDDFVEAEDIFEDPEESFAFDKDAAIPVKQITKADAVEKRRRVEEIMLKKELEKLYSDSYEDF